MAAALVCGRASALASALPRRAAARPLSVAVAATTTAAPSKPHLFSVAPMMEYTDAHQRFLFRLLSRRAVLYTEMVTTNALVRNEEDPRRFLEADFGVEEPVVLQLGGSDVGQMREAARIAHRYGYREVNINCGCPSEKVADAGCFGAALMLTPDVVSALACAVGDAIGRPATIKCRIGVNDADSYEGLHAFVRTVSEGGGVGHFIVHARKAVLGAKFSPDDNRKIPPLRYDYVYRLAQDFPHLQFTLNGGVNTLDDCQQVLTQQPLLAGVMVGRACVNSVFHWANVDSVLYGEPDANHSRRHILQAYATYAQGVEDRDGARARRALVKPLLGLFTAEPNGRLFRAKLDEGLLVQQPRPLPISQVILSAAEGALKPLVLNLLPSQLKQRTEIYAAASAAARAAAAGVSVSAVTGAGEGF